MALCQNESEITEAIKAAKAFCAQTSREVEAYHGALISEAKIQHAACIKEAEADCVCTLAEAGNCCSTAIREVESQGASQAHLQQSHAKDIQHLEAEAIEEEKMDFLAFLATYGTTLRASPPEACRIMVTPSIFCWECSNVCPTKHSPRGIPPSTGTHPTDSSCLCHQSTQALAIVQAVTQLAKLGGSLIPIRDHLQSDS